MPGSKVTHVDVKSNARGKNVWALIKDVETVDAR